MGKGGDSSNKQSIQLKRETALKKAGLEDFFWLEDPQWHRSRARLMLKENKTVTKLMGFDTSTKYKVLFAILLQWASLELLQDAPFWMWFFCCYTLSGTINGAMTLAMHELSHNLGGKGVIYNRILAILANLPMGLPAAATFKRYHMEHHKYMGEDEIDVDIPTEFEGSNFQHSIMKALWLFFQPAWYSLRPLVVAPKQAQAWEIINFLCTATVDAAVLYGYGVKGVAYLALGTIFGMQFHPIAGHFVAEHFVLHDEQETYSYYGPLNWFTFNVGYHNEHHDFPFVAGNKLPVLRKLCPGYFDEIPHYHSWVKVLYDFVVDDKLTPFSRVKRSELTPEELQDVKTRGGVVKL